MAFAAFDQLFPQIAKQEICAVQAGPGTFVFREHYCAVPGCNCRRAILEVHWLEEKLVAATIEYAFDRPKRRNEHQISLVPTTAPDELAYDVLEVFEVLIERDKAYRASLLRHYELWRTAVDDPASAAHAELRGTKRRAGKEKQVVNQSLERMAAKTSQVDSKLQQRFRKLLAKVEALRSSVLAWKQQRADIDREIAICQALVEKESRLKREMVLLLDRASSAGGFSKADQKTLGEMIRGIAGELLANGPDDELKRVYDRHSRRGFDRENAEIEADSVATLRAMMESMGLEFGDARINSVEELRSLTESQLDAADAAQEARRATRKKSAKQLANEAKRADEQRGAHKAVQDVFRSLAKALHPDREQDPVERVRKAELMKEVNVAYEADDLLRLLELELELEKVDVSGIEMLAEERVRHYTRVLDEQAKQLMRELEELEMPFRVQLDLSPRSKLVPADVIGVIEQDADQVRVTIDALTNDLKTFVDPLAIKRWLKTERRIAQQFR